MGERVLAAATAYLDTLAQGVPVSSANGMGKRVSAVAIAFLQARTQLLVRGASSASLRNLCTPASGLADYIEWWAVGTRDSSYGRAIGVPRQGYASASLVVDVKRVTIDQPAGTASVLAFTQPGASDDAPGHVRNVDSESAFHLVRLVRAGDGHWLASADIATFNRDLPTFLQAGGAPPAVVAAARAEDRLVAHPGKPPAGCLATLRDWCKAMNARDVAAIRGTFTPDTADILPKSTAQLAATLANEDNPRDWRVVNMRLLGIQIDGIACGWVYYHFISDEPASMVGSRGYGSFAFLERQPDGRWLIFSI